MKLQFILDPPPPSGGKGPGGRERERGREGGREGGLNMGNFDPFAKLRCIQGSNIEVS